MASSSACLDVTLGIAQNNTLCDIILILDSNLAQAGRQALDSSPRPPQNLDSLEPLASEDFVECKGIVEFHV